MFIIKAKNVKTGTVSAYIGNGRWESVSKATDKYMWFTIGSNRDTRKELLTLRGRLGEQYEVWHERVEYHELYRANNKRVLAPA